MDSVDRQALLEADLETEASGAGARVVVGIEPE